MARNSPVAICATKQIPSNDPKFHHPLIVDGVGRSTNASFASLNRRCLCRMGFAICLAAEEKARKTIS
jgi:hypothetical protein